MSLALVLNGNEPFYEKLGFFQKGLVRFSGNPTRVFQDFLNGFNLCYLQGILLWYSNIGDYAGSFPIGSADRVDSTPGGYDGVKVRMNSIRLKWMGATGSRLPDKHSTLQVLEIVSKLLSRRGRFATR